MPLFSYLFAIYLLLRPTHASYVGYSYRRMGAKIVYLDMELVKDAERKIQSVHHLKSFYRASHKFQLATLIYDIRFKFKRMVRLYRVAFDNMISEDHNVHIIRWMEVHQISMEIDNLVQAVVDGETNYAKLQKERIRKMQKELAKSSSTTDHTTEGNNSLRMGKPMWNFQSPDPWNRPRPQHLRTLLPQNFRRTYNPLHMGTKRPVDGVELNY